MGGRVRTADAVPMADDVLVFRAGTSGFRLIGGTGRGAGWASIVDATPADNPHLERAWRSGGPIRLSSDEPVRVAGPYWTNHAVVVSVGHEHVVVFGGASVREHPDAAYVTAAARAVADTGEASAEKLLADELEVVHAVRTLTSYQPRSVRETARHIATVAARALSCDVAAVRVRCPTESMLEVLLVATDGVDADPRRAGRDAGTFLEAAATSDAPIVEQTVGPNPEIWTDRVVSRMTTAIGPQTGLGAMALGHAEGHERGFTSLCQRIARALAESAEPMLMQAIAHEQLSNERESFQRATHTDSLTGVGNRAAWDAALRVLEHGRRYAVLSADLDDLKQINDKRGHSAGDAALRAAAEVMRASLRADDVVCRVGGDEFLVLLSGAGERDARAAAKRIRDAAADGVNSHGPIPSLSIGWAVFDDDWAAAIGKADQRMYADKRRKDASARSLPTRATTLSDAAVA